MRANYERAKLTGGGGEGGGGGGGGTAFVGYALR